ncbi:Hypothetical_protein [Hexamita inflata]|uniref:Hypothetical_protein n=1 Tax=Hexamita inflata TaxID=28002 RepID=A0ABP1GF29_9EUKA
MAQTDFQRRNVQYRIVIAPHTSTFKTGSTNHQCILSKAQQALAKSLVDQSCIILQLYFQKIVIVSQFLCSSAFLVDFVFANLVSVLQFLVVSMSSFFHLSFLLMRL